VLPIWPGFRDSRKCSQAASDWQRRGGDRICRNGANLARRIPGSGPPSREPCARWLSVATPLSVKNIICVCQNDVDCPKTGGNHAAERDVDCSEGLRHRAQHGLGSLSLHLLGRNGGRSTTTPRPAAPYGGGSSGMLLAHPFFARLIHLFEIALAFPSPFTCVGER